MDPVRAIPSSAHPRPLVLWATVATATLAISSASILVRLAEAPPLSIAAYRVSLAALFVGCSRFRKRGRPRPHRDRSILAVVCLSGLFLALHFAFWITSLTMTSIASSVTLVSTTPIFVAMVASRYLKERFPRRFLGGVLLTLIGSSAIAGLDSALSATALSGDLLALAGAGMASGYLISGRVARRSLSLFDYAFGSYGTAALILVLICIVAGRPLHGFSRSTYAALVLLALVPQLVGHTAFNWTLKFLSPTTVSVLILGEPIGATILGYVILGEGFGIFKGAGLALLGIGILLCALNAPAQADDWSSQVNQQDTLAKDPGSEDLPNKSKDP